MVPTGWARTTPSTSLAAAATSPAASLSVMIQIGCASPGGKCADSVSKPVADSDCTRNFSSWSRPIEVPNSPVAMTVSSASPASRLTTGRSDTWVATARQARP